MPFLKKTFVKEVKRRHPDRLKVAIALEKDRVDTLSDFPKNLDFFFHRPEYPIERLIWKGISLDTVKENLLFLLQIIEKVSERTYNEGVIKDRLTREVAKRGRDKGAFFWPLRVALSGKDSSPSPFDIAAVIEKKETLERIHHAINKIEQTKEAKG